MHQSPKVAQQANSWIENNNYIFLSILKYSVFVADSMCCTFDNRDKTEEVELQIVPAVTISEANLDRLIELPQILAKVNLIKHY